MELKLSHRYTMIYNNDDSIRFFRQNLTLEMYELIQIHREKTKAREIEAHMNLSPSSNLLSIVKSKIEEMQMEKISIKLNSYLKWLNQIM